MKDRKLGKKQTNGELYGEQFGTEREIVWKTPVESSIKCKNRVLQILFKVFSSIKVYFFEY